MRKDFFEKDEEDSDEDLEEIAKVEGSDEEGLEIMGRCLVLTIPKSPMTTTVPDLLVSLHIPINSYHVVLCDFDETCSYLIDMLSSMSSKIECLELKISNFMCDRDGLKMDNKMLVKQCKIYYNTTKCLYGKLTDLYDYADICVEQHR